MELIIVTAAGAFFNRLPPQWLRLSQFRQAPRIDGLHGRAAECLRINEIYER